MKKLLTVGLFLLIIAAVVVPTFAYDWSYLIPTLPGSGDDNSGGSGTETWDRNDLPCPDGIREKTFCLKDGSEQCTAQYCN